MMLGLFSPKTLSIPVYRKHPRHWFEWTVQSAPRQPSTNSSDAKYHPFRLTCCVQALHGLKELLL